MSCLGRLNPMPYVRGAGRQISETALNAKERISPHLTARNAGIAVAATGVAMLIIAGVLAAGVLGGGAPYYAAAGLTAGSIIPFCIATALMCNNNSDGFRTIDTRGSSPKDRLSLTESD